MGALEPIINLLVVLTVLSVAAERATNLLKLRNADLRTEKDAKTAEKLREAAITMRTVLVGIVLALLVKADFFELLHNLDAPWTTLGWVQVDGSRWVRSPASAGFGTAIYAASGCLITGVALGFGSKFWHDILDAVFEIRGVAQGWKERLAKEKGE